MLSMNRSRILEAHVLPKVEAGGPSTVAFITPDIRTVAVPLVLE
jgi:hypothetical protein